MAGSIFEVESSFTVIDEATAPLTAIAEAFERITAAADEATAAARKFARVNFDKFTASVTAASDALKGMGEAAASSGDAAAASARGTDSATAANEAYAASARNAAEAHETMRAAMSQSITPHSFQGEPMARNYSGAGGFIGRDYPTYDTTASYDEPHEAMRQIERDGGGLVPMGGGGSGGGLGYSGSGGGAAGGGGAGGLGTGTPWGPTPGGGAAGGGGSGRGFNGVSAPRRGFHLLGLPELATEFTVGYGVDKAAEIDRDIRIARLNAGDKDGALNSESAGYQDAAATIQNAQLGTIASEADVAGIYAHVRGEARGRFNTDAAFDSSFRSVVNYGELSHAATGENVINAAKAGYREIDAFRAENPAQAEMVLSNATNLASLSNATAQQEANILRYGLRTSNVDAAHSAAYMRYLAPMQQAMGNVSTVGTGASAIDLELVEAASHTGSKSQRRHADNEARRLRAAMAGTDELAEHDREHKEGGSGNKHEAGFKALGLIDAAGNRTDIGADGVTDYDKRGAILRSHFLSMGSTAYQQAAIQAAGVRGGGALMPIGAATAGQTNQYGQAIGPNAPTVDQRQEIGQNAAMQQFQTTEAAASTALADLGRATLPALKLAAEGLTVVFQHLSSIVNAHPDAGAAVVGGIGATLAAGAISAVVGGGRGALKGTGLLRGATAGGLTGLGTAGAIVGAGLAGYGVGYEIEKHTHIGSWFADNVGRDAEALGWGGSVPEINPAVLARHRGGSYSAEASAKWGAMLGGTGSQGGGNISTTVGAPQVTVSITGGVIDNMVNQAIAKMIPMLHTQMSDALNHSLMSSGGFAGGSMSSAFAVGGQ